jgi:quinohemoprotein ethanol dehydrogenase
MWQIEMGRLASHAVILTLALFSCCMPAHAASPIDAARLRDPGSKDWLTVGRTYGEQNYSPLAQINEHTVGQLGLAWFYDLGADRGVEAAPLEADGVLYNIQPWNITTALDARTGRLLWRYDPHVPQEFARKACCDIDSRGLALWQGEAIIATLDGRLIALDTRTGRPLWSVQTLDEPGPFTITGAPRVFDGKVVIGNSGSDLGTRGYVTAYDAATGRRLWRFYPTPGDPAKGFEDRALQRAAQTWHGEYWKVGNGGNVWDAMAYDPELKLIYLGTGNAYPWVAGGDGDRLFSDSIVAVDAATGKYVWHYQETPNDQWDYDAAEPMILTDLTMDGQLRHVLMQAPKNGFFYVLDRTNGKLISASPYVRVSWASRIDPATGRPVLNPKARVTEVPVMVAPGPSGGHSFNPMSYSLQTGLAYFPVVESFFAYASTARAEGDVVTQTTNKYDAERRRISQYAEEHLRAWLTAWDPVRQREIWRVPAPRNGSGGVMATAGNLVFEGTIDKTFVAYRATDGAKLWETPIQNVAIGSPISYELDGKQYIAVNAGWGGGTARVESSRFADLHVSASRLLVFELGGTAHLPAAQEQGPQSLDPPPKSTASAQLIARGEALYAKNCALCHGAEARGGVKDLRHMSREAHAQFFDIVLGGARKSKGMASFGDLLSRADAGAIHAYLIKRANDDWQPAGTVPASPSASHQGGSPR